MSDKELKPCPFCGTELCEIARSLTEYPYAVRCGWCHTEGPERPTKAEAIAAWNKRFVCLDEKGEPVCAGDEVRNVFGQQGIVVMHELSWVLKVGDRYWGISPDEIELIKEGGK